MDSICSTLNAFHAILIAEHVKIQLAALPATMGIIFPNNPVLAAIFPVLPVVIALLATHALVDTISITPYVSPAHYAVIQHIASIIFVVSQ